MTSYRMDFSVSWEELHRDARALALRLMNQEWKGVIAITRGGLIPAAIVARELDLRLVETICVASYDHKSQGEAKILKDLDIDSEGWLVIDDLVDTGQTAKAVRKMLPKAHLATVFSKPEGRPYVDTFVTEVSQDTWILFPWDGAMQFTRPMVARE
jgi:xanthine phosphoribosyltransferase